MFNGFLVLFLFPLFQTRISCATKSHKSSSNFVHHTRYEILFQLHLIILISGYVPNKGQKLSPRTVFFKCLPKVSNPFARQTFKPIVRVFGIVQENSGLHLNWFYFVCECSFPLLFCWGYHSGGSDLKIAGSGSFLRLLFIVCKGTLPH